VDSGESDGAVHRLEEVEAGSGEGALTVRRRFELPGSARSCGPWRQPGSWGDEEDVGSEAVDLSLGIGLILSALSKVHRPAQTQVEVQTFEVAQYDELLSTVYL